MPDFHGPTAQNFAKGAKKASKKLCVIKVEEKRRDPHDLGVDGKSEEFGHVAGLQ